MRVTDVATIVLLCPLEQSEIPMAAAPADYGETDHYRGWPAVLARLDAIIGVEQLRLTDSRLDSVGDRDRVRFRGVSRS